MRLYTFRNGDLMGRLTFSSAAAIALIFSGLAAIPAKADTYPPCTIFGTSASETINGTSGDDVICNAGGDDTINGLAGNDVIIVEGPGAVVIDGGAGDDKIDARLGTSSNIVDNLGSNYIFGTDGVDVISGDAALNQIETFAGNDLINGGSGVDWAKAGSGDDVLWGGAGNDKLWGGEGIDILDGQGGDDILAGDEGNDSLTAAGPGFESLGGGDGNDVLTFTGPAGGGMSGGDGDDILDATLGTGGTFWGGRGDDLIRATPGDDTIGGEQGSDKIYAYGGNDTISNYADGNSDENIDLVYAGPGNDIISGADNVDLIYGEVGNDRTEGSGGNDVIYGGNGDDKLVESSGSDTIYGGEGNDTLEGGDGDDILQGDSGNDIIYGQNENDSLIGGTGDDRLGGGEGIDTFDGGDGTNLCDFDIGETKNELCSFDSDAPELTITRDRDSVDVGESGYIFINVNFKASDISGFKRLQYNCTSVGVLDLNFENRIFSNFYPVSQPFELNGNTNSKSLDVTIRMGINKDAMTGPIRCQSYAQDIFSQQAVRQEPQLIVYQTLANQPAAPTNLKFKATNPTSGSLTWDFPKTSGLPLMSSYTVQYSVDNLNWTTITVSDILKTSVQLNDLPQNTNFTFRVRGNNGLVAFSKYQLFTWATVFGSTPSANNALNPTKLKVSNLTSSGLKLNWVPPVGGADFNLTGYSAEISSNGTDWQALPVSSAKSTSLTAKNLKVGTTYQIRLASVSGQKIGAYSYTSVRTLSSAPGVPREFEVTTNPKAKVYLVWQRPESTGGEKITGYKVEFSTDKGKTWKYQFKSPTPSFHFFIGITPPKTYYYRVSAINKIGTGAPSAISKFTTKK